MRYLRRVGFLSGVVAFSAVPVGAQEYYRDLLM